MNRKKSVYSLLNKPVVVVGAIVWLGLSIRLFRLDSVPAEMWGDVIEHYKMATAVLNEEFTIMYWFGGDGPLMSYIAALVSLPMGLSFISLKLTTVIIGSALIGITYWLAKLLFNRHLIGYLAAYFVAVWFWGISLSRQAKPYILVPLFVGLILILLLKKRYWIAGLATGLGMYVQASFWGGLGFALYHPLALLVSMPVMIPFLRRLPSLIADQTYIGSKMAEGTNLAELAQHLGVNVWHNLQSFGWRGDMSFRHNIPHQPHIDLVSAILFFTGLVLIILLVVVKRQYKYLFFLLLPLIFIQIPSVLDTANWEWGPYMGRMAGVIPLVAIIASVGMVKMADLVSNLKLRRVMMFAILLLIGSINLYRYFEIYPRTLPNNNSPFGIRIAQHIRNQIDLDTAVVMLDCCWGEWGQPEPQAIEFNIEKERKFYHSIARDWNFDDGKVENQKAVFVLDPDETRLLQEIDNFHTINDRYILNDGQWQIAQLVLVDI